MELTIIVFYNHIINREMNMNRPEFKNFPLSSEDIRQLNQTKQSLTKEMQTNQRQIQELAIKSSQNNYEVQLLKRLKEKSMILRERMRENQEILTLQQTMERDMKYKKAQTLKQRKQLAEEYKGAIQQKRSEKLKLKEKEKQMERDIHKRNQFVDEEVERNRKNKEQARKKDYIASIEVMEMVRKQMKQEKEKNKKQLNEANQEFVRNDEQFEKHYKQYKQTFLINNSSSNSSPPKTTLYSNGILSSTTLDPSLMLNNLNNMEKYKRDQQHKLDLQDSLKQQIQWRDMKKQKEKEESRIEKEMTDFYVMRNAQADRLEKEIKREMQKEYEQQLNRQVQIKEYLASRERWRDGSRQKGLSQTAGRMSNMANVGNNSLF